MQTDPMNWGDNKILMCDLWPKWKPTPAEAALLNERWGQLKQDKLRECIKNNRMSRNQIPDLTSIHAEYCKITGQESAQIVAHSEVETTRRNASEVQGPTPQEYADWDAWAKGILATATRQEIESAQERLGISPDTHRVLAVAIDYCRKNPPPRR
jgi:hypothetical protein